MRHLLALGALALVATPAFAQEVSVSGNVALTTDYHWRNVTQSNQDIAIQGGLDVDFGNGFSLGTWASSVDFQDEPDDTNVEVDFYGAYGWSAGGADFSVGAIYYTYPDAEDSDLNFFELNAGVSKEFESGVSLGGTINWDPDNETVYADFSTGYSFSDAFSVDAGYGKYLDGFGEYGGWNLGGTWSVMGVDLDLRYYDNDMSGDNDNVVFSIGKSM
ncbi:MAG: TorF family putative porin [Hyphomonadaceae bacterium]